MVQLLDPGEHVPQGGERLLRPCGEARSPGSRRPRRPRPGCRPGSRPVAARVLAGPADADPPLPGLVRRRRRRGRERASSTRGVPSAFRTGPPSTRWSTRTGTLFTLATTICRISRQPAGLLGAEDAAASPGRSWRARLVRILALPDQPERPHDDGRCCPCVRLSPLPLTFALPSGGLELGERDAVLAQPVRVGLDLVALDGPADAGDAGDPRHAQEFAVRSRSPARP